MLIEEQKGKIAMKITDKMLVEMANYTIERPGIPADWVYLGDNEERYVIGEPKEKNILIIGVNPGWSMPGTKRQTTLKVTEIIKQKFDADYGWIMVNLYPQRSSKPKDITLPLDDTMIHNNLRVIEYVVKEFDIQKIWCAWGNAIDKVGNGVLHTSHKDICEMINKLDGTHEWYHYGELTKKGNPRHPRFVPENWDMKPSQP